MAKIDLLNQSSFYPVVDLVVRCTYVGYLVFIRSWWLVRAGGREISLHMASSAGQQLQKCISLLFISQSYSLVMIHRHPRRRNPPVIRSYRRRRRSAVAEEVGGDGHVDQVAGPEE